MELSVDRVNNILRVIEKNGEEAELLAVVDFITLLFVTEKEWDTLMDNVSEQDFESITIRSYKAAMDAGFNIDDGQFDKVASEYGYSEEL